MFQGRFDTHLDLGDIDLVNYRFLQNFIVHEVLALLGSCIDVVQCIAICQTKVVKVGKWKRYSNPIRN